MSSRGRQLISWTWERYASGARNYEQIDELDSSAVESDKQADSHQEANSQVQTGVESSSTHTLDKDGTSTDSDVDIVAEDEDRLPLYDAWEGIPGATVEMDDGEKEALGMASPDRLIPLTETMHEETAEMSGPVTADQTFPDPSSVTHAADEEPGLYPDLFERTFTKQNIDPETIVGASDEEEEASDVDSGRNDPHVNGDSASRTMPSHSDPRAAVPKPKQKHKHKPAVSTARSGPDVDRNLSSSLKDHYRFHERVAALIPRLPVSQTSLYAGAQSKRSGMLEPGPMHGGFDWGRRYWIAILPPGKQPKKVNSEKDLIWLKGNKYSTVRTVREAYLSMTFALPEQTILLMGRDKPELHEQMQELDLFSDRLCVFRVVNAKHKDAAGRSIIHGLVPEIAEIVEIDD